MARKLAFRTVEFTVDDKPVTLSYRGQMLAVLRAPKDPSRGATFDEVIASARVIGAIEAAPVDGPVVLEDADWQHLVDKLKHFPFPFCATEIADFCRAVEGAEEVRLEAVTGGGED